VARIAGVNIPAQKRVEIALRYIYGIGPDRASAICNKIGIPTERRVNELTDDEKIAALSQRALARGLTLSSGVLPYLITHFRRDMRSLSATLDALDRYSLETKKRAITLPLLRDLLLHEPETTEQ